MVRRHRTNPHFLTTTGKQCLDKSRAVANAEVLQQCNESEIRGEHKGVPSKYNLFHCSGGVVGDEIEWYSPSSPVCSEISETALPRPTSSVQIKEIEFADNSHEASSKRHTGDSQNREKKSAVSNSCDKTKVKQKRKETKCPAPKRRTRPLTEERRQTLSASKSTASKVGQSCSNTSEGSTSHGQTFTESVRQALQPHTKELSAIAHTRGKLSDFFLSEVEQTDVKTSDEQLGADTREIKDGKTSKPVLPISATVWLPANSVFTEDKKLPPTHSNPHLLEFDANTTEATPPNTTSDCKPNPLFRPPEPHTSLPSPDCLSTTPDPPTQHSVSRRNPLLEASVYLETDLPPPNRDRNNTNSPSQQVNSPSYSPSAQPSNTCTLGSTDLLFQPNGNVAAGCSGINNNLTLSDSESDTEEATIKSLDDFFSEEGNNLNGGYGEDSKALEELAWELQSISGGRLTQCEGEWEEEGGEGEEGEEGGGEGGEEEEGEELEAGFERIKSSFEMYQHQLMHQDSD